jgi:hypothetical protein
VEVYIYEADLWCVDCGEEKRAELRAAGRAPKNPDDECTYDSDDFPKGPTEEGESDSPSHCAGCGCFLESDLTPDGLKYAAEHVAEAIGNLQELAAAPHNADCSILEQARDASPALAHWAPHYFDSLDGSAMWSIQLNSRSRRAWLRRELRIAENVYAEALRARQSTHVRIVVFPRDHLEKQCGPRARDAFVAFCAPYGIEAGAAQSGSADSYAFGLKREDAERLPFDAGGRMGAPGFVAQYEERLRSLSTVHSPVRRARSELAAVMYGSEELRTKLRAAIGARAARDLCRALRTGV